MHTLTSHDIRYAADAVGATIYEVIHAGKVYRVKAHDKASAEEAARDWHERAVEEDKEETLL